MERKELKIKGETKRFGLNSFEEKEEKAMKRYLQLAVASVFTGILVGTLIVSNAWASPNGYQWEQRSRADVRSSSAPAVQHQGSLNSSRAVPIPSSHTISGGGLRIHTREHILLLRDAQPQGRKGSNESAGQPRPAPHGCFEDGMIGPWCEWE